MDTNQRNLLLAILISVVILGGFQYFYQGPLQEEARRQAALAPTKAETAKTDPTQQPAGIPPLLDRDQALAQSPRVKVKNALIEGSIARQGARIDDVVLTKYRETIDQASPPIHLLQPAQTSQGYYAEFGWLAAPEQGAVQLPTAQTIWQANSDQVTPQKAVTLTYDNGQGLVFEQRFGLDDHYLIHVAQTVKNISSKPVTLNPFALLSRREPETGHHYGILHEGIVGVLNGKLVELKYDEVKEEKAIARQTAGGWLGITDKYWLTALAPENQGDMKTRVAYSPAPDRDRYQVDYVLPSRTIGPGESVTVGHYLFAGAKEVKLLDAYEDKYNIPRFDLAVDFGWFYFLTKPIFLLLHFMYQLLGSFGLAILGLTVIIRLIVFPLANKSYRTMNKLKDLQPEMLKLREKHKGDVAAQHKEMAAFYQRHQVNPLSGCLPILIQIPIFFSLYKVLFVTIEMRHQPFYGWIHDLSAPDPTTIFNLFGLIPWDPPTFLMIGAWPIIMGFTMWLQQRMSPSSMDPAQARVFALLPFIFTYLLAQFPAGLVIYWAWSNILGIGQQYFIRVLDKKHRAKIGKA
ncbi:MAG: membrane protein insertase YidC [Dongiaceae bacterium]